MKMVSLNTRMFAVLLLSCIVALPAWAGNLASGDYASVSGGSDNVDEGQTTFISGRFFCMLSTSFQWGVRGEDRRLPVG